MTGNVARAYATAVVQVLRKHFPDLTDPLLPSPPTMPSTARRATPETRSSSSWMILIRHGSGSRLTAGTGAASASPTSR